MWRAITLAMGIVLAGGAARAEHAKINLDVVTPGGQKTAHVDQTPPDSGKNPRPVVKARVNEPIKINWLFTNVYPHKTLENVVVHFFIAREEKVGQKELPDMRGDVVLESAFEMDFKPGGKAGQRNTLKIETPGVYLIRVESRQTGSDHEHFSAIDLVVEGNEKPQPMPIHSPLTIDGPWFRDDRGRAVLLRGVNLGGSSKTPTETDSLSFVGRPFPLEKADEHFGRLRRWGFNCIRLLTTWEAIEHDGPGRYDEPYLDYFTEIVRRAGRHRLHVFIDPHQDAWSRFSGGDGAPSWTLELAGFRLETLDASEAAITPRRPSAEYPPMIWPNNWYRLASATMFTLFFAGEALAPRLRVEGESIQHYLQRHFIGAMSALARRLSGFPHVLGYDSLNEPTAGYIGLEGLSRPLPVYNSAPRLTGLESLAIPAGFPTAVPYITREHLNQRQTGTVVLNPDGSSAWKGPEHDVWREHGVWDVDGQGRPRLLLDDYFAHVRFGRDGLRPFLRRYAEAISTVHPGAIFFIEGEPGSGEPLAWDGASPIVNASHWYDLLTLITKHYDPEAALVWGSDQTVQGSDAVRESFARQISAHVEDSRRFLNGAPTLIGEFGLPFDLDGGAAFRSGDFSPQIAALSAYYDALDANLVHSALWNYTSDNTNDQGDGWNGEDLSIFSRDQQTDREALDSGGRAVAGFCRPTLRACAGRPLSQVFDRATGEFVLTIAASGAADPTDIYLPRIHYPHGIESQATTGWVKHDPEVQVLHWGGVTAGTHRLSIQPRNQ